MTPTLPKVNDRASQPPFSIAFWRLIILNMDDSGASSVGHSKNGREAVMVEVTGVAYDLSNLVISVLGMNGSRMYT